VKLVIREIHVCVFVGLPAGRVQTVLPVSQLAVFGDSWRGVWAADHTLQLLDH